MAWGCWVGINVKGDGVQHAVEAGRKEGVKEVGDCYVLYEVRR